MPSPDDVQVVCYWSNAVWCYRHELDQMGHMSDDYATVELPADLDGYEIDHAIHERVSQ